MIKPANYFKLGILVLVALVALVATAAGIGAKALERDTLAFHAYFDESVQGLEIGSPVKFRGVRIGSVGEIRVAPDRHHIEVVADIDAEEAENVGLAVRDERSGQRKPFIPSDIRAQLGSNGVTGVRYLLIDTFDPVHAPEPVLPFEPIQPHIPSAMSLFKSLEDMVVASLQSMPDVSRNLLAITARIDRVLAELEKKGFPDKAAEAVADASSALRDLRAVMKSTKDAQLPEKTSVALADLDVAIKKLDRVAGRMDGDDGLVASARRATDALAGAGNTATGSIRKADDTVKSIGDAADAIRDLTDVLERDPDMLLKGRAKEEKR